MCDSDCVSARTYEEEAARVSFLEYVISKVLGVSSDTGDFESMYDDLIIWRDLLELALNNPKEFDKRFEYWVKMKLAKNE